MRKNGGKSRSRMCFFDAVMSRKRNRRRTENRRAANCANSVETNDLTIKRLLRTQSNTFTNGRVKAAKKRERSVAGVEVYFAVRKKAIQMKGDFACTK